MGVDGVGDRPAWSAWADGALNLTDDLGDTLGGQFEFISDVDDFSAARIGSTFERHGRANLQRRSL
jgi:hypothetical protein